MGGLGPSSLVVTKWETVEAYHIIKNEKNMKGLVGGPLLVGGLVPGPRPGPLGPLNPTLFMIFYAVSQKRSPTFLVRYSSKHYQTGTIFGANITGRLSNRRSFFLRYSVHCESKKHIRH